MATPALKLNGLKLSANDTIVYATAYGAKFDGTTDDTAALQAANDAIAGLKGRIICPGGTTRFSNLKLNAWTQLCGAGMGQVTIFKRIGGSVGTAIREKTAAEGNASGAGGIWIRDIYVDGNATAGNGIDLGNQVASNQLNFLSGLENVFVYNFTTGTGMIINQNAARCSYIWSNSNATGIITQGGGGFYSGVWAEGNTTLNMDVQSSDDTFSHVHIEQSGTGAPATGLLKVTGAQNRFFGISLVQTSNITQAVYINAGAVRNAFYETMLNTNGFTFSNVVYVNAWAFGTGATDYRVPFFVDMAGGQAGYWYNQSDNTRARMVGSAMQSISLDTPYGNDLAIGAVNAQSVTIGTASIPTSIVGAVKKTKRTPIADTIYTALSTDYLIAYTSLTAGRTVTIPTAAAGNNGQVYVIKNESAGAFAITIAPASGTIDGAASVATTAVARAPAVRVYSNGAAWFTW
jgi:hypothetical protein